MTNIRQLVLKILAGFDDHPGDPERIADKVLARKRIEHRDRSFVFELVYGVLRNRIYLDYVIDSFLAAGRKLDRCTLRRILQMGAYQILFLDRVPDHAAVNESVELAKKDKAVSGASGMVNAVLRNIIKNKFNVALPDPQVDLSARLSIEFSHPKWMVERWLERYGLGNTKKLLTFNNERPSIHLRRKMHGLSRQQFEHDVRTLCESAGGYLNLYYKMKVSLAPENLRLIQNGLCSVQAPSSGWVVALMDLKHGDRVADLCSAPGGKATLAAEIVGETGSVAACDRGRWKARMISDAIHAMGLMNVYPLVCDSTQPPFSRQFDKILLDAPCTGSGVLQRHPDARAVRKLEDIDEMSALQTRLLDSAANMVDKGGTIVYSTCSLEREENEDQVEKFLSAHPDFQLVPPPSAIPAIFIDDNSKCLRITPFQHGMDGMFGARFRKT
ncbi:MAG: 16S rRNA (cytosine(967)-C(5))-methyltransferase RsmB [Chitinispirillia bacterium]|nr:16S rRNA (cytosine(967)-C(5))-methyltransferase RsmB [Chitinispirillia bacterium]MCL2242544.1 16S rRNA (cytosine(967)-C(5))-methyltransferase RsmB [Chitinispirillia bacterium]